MSIIRKQIQQYINNRNLMPKGIKCNVENKKYAKISY